MRPWLIAVAGLALVSGVAHGQAGPPSSPIAGRLGPQDVGALRTFVEAGLRELDIPGAAVAVVDHGEVVLEEGLGVRELGRPSPVDPDTLFMIGPATKALTTLLLAKFVDQGRLTWDEPVARTYPAFRLADDAAASAMTMRRLVCGCAGLPAETLERRLGATPGMPASGVFARLARLRPAPASDGADDDDLAVAAAGFIAAHVAKPRLELGDAFDAVMQQEVLSPLGMARTTFDMTRALAGDHAAPHGTDLEGQTATVSPELDYAFVPYRPAEGAWSSAHDLIRYVRLELSEGLTPDGGRLLSEQALLARRRPEPMSGERPDRGLGLAIARIQNHAVIAAAGGAPGYQGELVVLPEAQIGAVLLTNAESGRFLLAPFRSRLFELILGGPDQARAELTSSATRARSERAAARRGLSFPPAADETALLASDYACPELGRLSVRREGSGVEFDFGAWKSAMAARRQSDGTVAFVTVSPAAGHIEFVAGRREGRRALILQDGPREHVYLES